MLVQVADNQELFIRILWEHRSGGREGPDCTGGLCGERDFVSNVTINPHEASRIYSCKSMSDRRYNSGGSN